MKNKYRTAALSTLVIASLPVAVMTGHAQSDRTRRGAETRIADAQDGDARLIRAHGLSGYGIEKVADSRTAIPAGTGNFVEFGIPSIRGGTVAFRADGDMGQKGVYASVGGTLRKVADLNTPCPGGSGNFTFFLRAISEEVSVSADGSVAFVGRSVDRSGIYTNQAGPLSILVDDTFPVPGKPGSTFSSFGSPSFEDGRVAFAASHDHFLLPGLYLADGSAASLVADSGTPIPGGLGNFTNIGPPSLRGADIAFPGQGIVDTSGRLQTGIYGLMGGTLRVIADRNTLVPGTTRTFGGFGLRAPALSDGEVAFENEGIYVARSTGLETVADSRTRIPGDLLLRFNSFGIPAIDKGKVAFDGQFFYELGPFRLLAESGLYTDIQDRLRRVISRRLLTPLDRRIVLVVFSGSEGLSDGSFAFKVAFRGGGEGIFVAKPM